MSRWSISALIVLLILIISAGWISRPVEADMRRVCPMDGGTRPDGTKFDPGSEARPSDHPIKIIDFTDQGELADRCQWSDFLLEFRDTAKPVFVVIYVHGWKHDGRPKDEDLQEFTNLIDTVQKQFKESRHVVGAFFAWPGLAGLSPIGENLSFWNRKTAADRVSISGNVAKLLAAVNSIRCQRENIRDMVVAIGHSFGARILFSSVSYAVLHDSQMKHPGSRGGMYGRISGAADLTILVNPAFEASRYSSIDSLRRPLETFDEAQQPVLLTVSTTGDYATRFAFPAGQIISGRWHERERTTLGNHPDFSTHVISRKTVETDAPAGDPSWWYDKFCHRGICLERTASEKDQLNPGNPFIVARTDTSIIEDHSKIWTDTFVNWITAFVLRTEQGLTVNGKRQGSCVSASNSPSAVPSPHIGLEFTPRD